MNTARMSEMTALGADWWNDSGVPAELGEAVALGAVGGTSNPVIVTQAARAHPELCLPEIERLARDFPEATEDELAWKLIHTLGAASAAQLLPVYERSRGRKGFLSIQVNPQYYRSATRMVSQAVELSRLAPNIAIKAPATATGLIAIEEMVARGLNVNATVSFSVAQAIAVAEAFERGLKRSRAAGRTTDGIRTYITIMIGRVDDQLKRVAAAGAPDFDPAMIDWAGIAVFKQAYRLLRTSGRPGVLLAAAYRHEGHWSQVIGREVLQTVPYTWWTKFNTSANPVRLTLDDPVDDRIVAALRARFPDFVRAYEPTGMAIGEFERYGASLHTLDQFLGGYADLLAFVRGAILR